jgi:hypothetical protein
MTGFIGKIGKSEQFRKCVTVHQKRCRREVYFEGICLPFQGSRPADDQSISPSEIPIMADRIERFARATHAIVEFCRNEGVSQASFHRWRRAPRDWGGFGTGQD